MDLARPGVVALPRTNLVKSQLSVEPGPLPFEAFTAHAPLAIGESTLREPLPVMSESGAVDVDLSPPSRLPYPSASAISTHELLERAASLGPGRMTWASIVLPADPILDEKRQPHVAERRERFTRMVKVGLGACLAVCVVALGVSALSGEASAATPATVAEARNTVPAQSVVPIEKLGGPRFAKASRRAATASAPFVRAKRR